MKKENRLLTIDGETLMSQPLTPLNFVVDTLLSQGLHILAGSPKVGKSWLALWLAVTVAKGETVWGMGVKQGTTLYLCLEDSTLRIQNRLFEITEDAPANVHFSTNSDTLGIVTASNCFFLFLNLHLVKVSDFALNGLDCFRLVDTFNVEIDNNACFQVQHIR